METDSFFYQFLKRLHHTVFDLIGHAPPRAEQYRFDSVELKKSLRIDGVVLPPSADLPVYFAEVQFQALERFYANLFAKVFSFLEENDANQDWHAVAIFASRSLEPKIRQPYRALLGSDQVHPVYLDELVVPPNPPLGLGILELLNAPRHHIGRIVSRVFQQSKPELVGSDLSSQVIELMEGLLIRRFDDLDREGVQKMLKIHNYRETKFWQQAHQEGMEEGVEKGIEKGIEKGRSLGQADFIRKLLAKGTPVREIAELLDLTVREVRRLAKNVGP